MRHESEPTCTHQNESRGSVIKLSSIDNWDELLDKPLGASVVRAKEDWIARLATTVVAL